MAEKILLILAAGMGSRYGGLKQIDVVGPSGEILMDYSLFDAKKAGFKRVLFIIKKQDEEAFEEAIGTRIKKHFEVSYAYQELSDIPEGFSLPGERSKPLGTAHALLAARDIIDAPFAVINADDFYGRSAFVDVAAFLDTLADPAKRREGDILRSCMISYDLANTLSPHGHVARGICSDDGKGRLVSIKEMKMIKASADGNFAEFSEDAGESWQKLDLHSLCSMNFWGFPPEISAALLEEERLFFERDLPQNPLKAEFLLPEATESLLRRAKCLVEIIPCKEKWIGMTYKEDKTRVIAEIKAMIDKGLYPENLWADTSASEVPESLEASESPEASEAATTDKDAGKD